MVRNVVRGLKASSKPKHISAKTYLHLIASSGCSVRQALCSRKRWTKTSLANMPWLHTNGLEANSVS